MIRFLLLGSIIGTTAFAKSDLTTVKAMAVLRGNCISCHNEEKHKGGLRLVTRNFAMKGGENGPVLNLKKPAESLLVQVLQPDSDPHMPPKKQLSNTDISALTKWISEGAKWDEKVLNEVLIEKPIQFSAMPNGYQPVLAMALSPDEKQLAVTRAEKVFIYDLSATNHSIVHEFGSGQDAVQSLAWSTNGALLAVGSFRKVTVLRMPEATEQDQFTNGFVGRITSLQFTPDATRLVASDGIPTKSGILGIVSLGNGTREGWEAHKDTIYGVRLSPDQKLLATVSADKLVKLWDLETRKEVRRFEAHLGHVLALAFNSEGTMLATGGADKVLNIWDVKTGKQEITITRHPAPITALVWVDGGKKLYSACEDGSVRRYSEFKTHGGGENSEGAQERVFTSTGDELYSLAASADGKAVFAGGYSGTVYAWNNEGKLLWKLEPRRLAISALKIGE